MKKISRTAMVIMFGFFTSIATAQTNSTPTDGGGYSCYDYNTGSFTYITAQSRGGYDTYYYGSGKFGAITLT